MLCETPVNGKAIGTATYLSHQRVRYHLKLSPLRVFGSPLRANESPPSKSRVSLEGSQLWGGNQADAGIGAAAAAWIFCTRPIHRPNKWKDNLLPMPAVPPTLGQNRQCARSNPLRNPAAKGPAMRLMWC